MDIIELTGLPFPAMPPAVRVLLVLAKYAAFGVIPMVIPSIARGPADPDPAHPAAAGHRLRLRQARSRSEVGYVFYIEPGPAPGHVEGLLGPGDPRRRAAAGAHRSTWTRSPTSRSSSFNFDKETQGRCRSSSSRSRSARRRSAMPIPDITPLNPPLGLVPPLPPKIEKLDDTAQMSAARGADGGPRLRRPAQRLRCSAAASSTSPRYGRVAEVAAAGRRARRGPAVRRPVLRQERHARDQARRLQAELHARPQRR